MAGAPWLVVRIKPLQYVRASENVRNQETEFYCPRAMIRSQRARVLRPEPLFPGYAFARPPDGRWAYLRSTVGVLDVLMAGGETPARVPDIDIARLKAREDADGFIRLESSQFKHGEHVRIDGGVFADLPGAIDGMPGRERVFVLLQLMGRAMRVEVDVRNVSRE